MGAVAKLDVSDTLGNLDSAFTSVLDARHERRLLEELGGCRRKLAEALAHMRAWSSLKRPTALAR